MKTATNALSAGNTPTASLILSLEASIMQQLDAGVLPELNPTVHEAAMTIKQDLNER